MTLWNFFSQECGCGSWSCGQGNSTSTRAGDFFSSQQGTESNFLLARFLQKHFEITRALSFRGQPMKQRSCPCQGSHAGSQTVRQCNDSVGYYTARKSTSDPQPRMRDAMCVDAKNAGSLSLKACDSEVFVPVT